MFGCCSASTRWKSYMLDLSASLRAVEIRQVCSGSVSSITSFNFGIELTRLAVAMLGL